MSELTEIAVEKEDNESDFRAENMKFHHKDCGRLDFNSTWSIAPASAGFYFFATASYRVILELSMSVSGPFITSSSFINSSMTESKKVWACLPE
ncbi:hypothetical protein C8R32_11539 [Nitrosospira sp. Nsp5]|uniref:Uncharacterized protein n=1 Tax=Nitrosospira multiformis TaxID=1231 RepID=A0ABY0TC24_9PROT|nr:hypothetical protein C8R32_11539 [Nitrosospira sp. Nsp5]SDQ60312.1 hypothetical protein SAMN05216402_1506 [Nitrosospira multiformis]